MHPLSTHGQEDISRLETDTGLSFSGYLATSEPSTMIPVLLRPDRSQQERQEKILRINKPA